MTYPVWPASLPQEFMMDGYSLGGEQPIQRQQMETGLDRVTQLSSSAVITNSYSFVLNDQQLEEFWSFYKNEAGLGASMVLVPMLTVSNVYLHLARFTSFPTQQRHGIAWRVSFSLETTQQQFDWS